MKVVKAHFTLLPALVVAMAVTACGGLTSEFDTGISNANDPDLVPQADGSVRMYCNRAAMRPARCRARCISARRSRRSRP